MPRVLANLLLPPGVATLLLYIPAALLGPLTPRWQEVAVVMLYAYGFAAVPSIAHALLMERCYRRGLLPSQGRAVIISSASGLLAGTLLAVIFLVGSSFSALSRLWPYPLLGAVTGAVVGLLIRVISRAQQKNT